MSPGSRRLVRRGMWSVAGLALVAAGVTGVGVLLPVAHTATVSASVPAPPDVVWRLITEVEAFPEWRSDVERVERLPDREGRAVWREAGPTGALTMEVVRTEERRLMETRIADRGLPFGGTWTYRLDPVAEGTRVTLTEDGEVYNPFFRFMARFVFGHDATMRTYLGDLSRRIEAGAGGV